MGKLIRYAKSGATDMWVCSFTKRGFAIPVLQTYNFKRFKRKFHLFPVKVLPPAMNSYTALGISDIFSYFSIFRM